MQKYIILILMASSISVNAMQQSHQPKPKELTEEEKQQLYLSRLPQELAIETLKFRIRDAQTPEQAVNRIRTSLATQHLNLSYKDLKEILKIMWDTFKSANIAYSDRIGIQLLLQIPLLKIPLKALKDENEFITGLKNPKEVAEYLARGGNINAQASDGNSALIMASFNNNIDLIDFLLQHAADVDLVNEKGETALYHAIVSVNTNLISLMLKRVSEINKIFDDPIAPTYLSKAAMAWRPDAVRLLLNAGADRNIKNSQGKTVLQFMIERAMFPISEIEIQIIDILQNYFPPKKK